MKKPCILLIGLSGESVFLRVNHFASPGETLHAHGLYHEPGGKAYNQAVAAARLGAESRLITAVGRDGCGQSCLDRLAQEGVLARGVFKDCPTAYAAIHTADGGENTVTVFPGASKLLSPQDLYDSAGLFTGADMLVLTCELQPDTLETAFSIASERCVPVLLNPAPFHPIAKKLMDRACLLTPNRGEACALLNLPLDATPKQIATAAGKWKTPLLVTLGAEGALLAEGSSHHFIPAPKVQAVDATGAGDAFAAALAVRLCLGDALADAAAYAVRYASISTQRPYVLNSYPYAEDLA